MGLAAFVLSTPVRAEETTAAQAPADPFSGVASLNVRSSTESHKESTYSLFLSPGLNLEYEFKDAVTVGLSARGRKDLNNEYHASFQDITLSAARSFEPIDGFGIGLDVSYSAPVDKDLYRYANSKGSLGASFSLSYRFKGALEGLAVNGGLAYARYLYSYQYADYGAILDKWSLSSSVGLSYSWKKLIVASASFTNVSSWDFAGDQERDNFLAVESIKWIITDEWSAQIGHINDGLTYDYMGQRNNTQLYDPIRSQVFIGASYKF